jgi:hypothetical protein
MPHTQERGKSVSTKHVKKLKMLCIVVTPPIWYIKLKYSFRLDSLSTLFWEHQILCLKDLFVNLQNLKTDFIATGVMVWIGYKMSRFYSYYAMKLFWVFCLVKMDFIAIISRTVSPSLRSSVMNDGFIYIQGDFLEPSLLSKCALWLDAGLWQCLISIGCYKIADCLKHLRVVCDFRNLVLDMENKLTSQSWRIVGRGGYVGKDGWVVNVKWYTIGGYYDRIFH